MIFMTEQTNKLQDKSQDLLLSLVEKATGAIGKGADFLGEEIPLLVQELITFKIWEHSVMLVVFLSMLFLVYKVYIKNLPLLINNSNNEYKRDTEAYPRKMDDFTATLVTVFGGVASFLLITAGAIYGSNHLISLIKATVAPRLYLLEYAAELTK